MDFGKIGGLLGQVAPTIATALGGPLAGLAVKTLSEAVLGTADGSEADIVAALTTADPEKLAALKKVDADFAVQMKKLDIDLAALDTQDRGNARAREIKTGDKTPRILAVIVVGGFFAMLMAVVFYGHQLDKNDAALIMFGGLSAAFTAIIAYYFGSSAGSAAKNEMFRDFRERR